MLVQTRQALVDSIIFLNQGTAADFCRMCGQYQLDLEFTNLLVERISTDVFLFKFLKQVIKRVWRRSIFIEFMLSPAADQMILLGNIGKVQKMGKSPGQGQNFFIF